LGPWSDWERPAQPETERFYTRHGILQISDKYSPFERKEIWTGGGGERMPRLMQSRSPDPGWVDSGVWDGEKLISQERGIHFVSLLGKLKEDE